MTRVVFRYTLLAIQLILFCALGARAEHASLPQKKISKSAVEVLSEGAIEDIPIAAKLVVDSAGEADAIANAKIYEKDNALPDVPSEANVDAATKPDVSKLPENQIPVLTGAKDAKKSSTNGFTRIATSVGVVALLLIGFMFVMKRWSKRSSKQSSTTRIKVLTQHSLGPKKSLAIIQVAGESMLVGITDQNISMLKTLALIDDEFPEDVPQNFDVALSDYDIEETRALPARAQRRLPAPETEDFAMRGLSEIRDKVSTRLKNMKNI